MEFSNELQKEFNAQLLPILEPGAAVTWDCVKLESNENIVLLHVGLFEIQLLSSTAVRCSEFEIVHRAVIHHSIYRVWVGWVNSRKSNYFTQRKRRLSSCTLWKTCTFITDCIATMSMVFCASVLTSNIAYSHRWVGCITHQQKHSHEGSTRKQGYWDFSDIKRFDCHQVNYCHSQACKFKWSDAWRLLTHSGGAK